MANDKHYFVSMQTSVFSTIKRSAEKEAESKDKNIKWALLSDFWEKAPLDVIDIVIQYYPANKQSSTEK